MVYVIAWSVYLVSAGLLLLAWWWLLGFFVPLFLRDPLWGCTVIVLLLPWYAGEQSQYFAPAFMVLALELFDETEYGSGAGQLLLAGTGLVLALVFLRWLLRWIWRTQG